MVALRYAAEDTGIPEGRVYQMDRIDPHVFDQVAKNQQGVAPGPLGYTAPPLAPQPIDLTASDAPTEMEEAPDPADLPLPGSMRMPPVAPATPAEVALIRNVGDRAEQINMARRSLARRRAERLTQERLAQMDSEMEQRRLIAGAEQPMETTADLPGTVAAGGTQQVGRGGCVVAGRTSGDPGSGQTNIEYSRSPPHPPETTHPGSKFAA